MGRKTIAVIAAVLLVLCSCSKSDDNTLYLYNWTYYMPDSIVKGFEEETGIRVVIDNFSSNEEMFAKISAGGGKGYDIIFPSADYTSIMIKLGMLERIDHSKVDSLKYIPSIIEEKADYDPKMEYSVPYLMGAAGIAVNRNKVSGYERSWNIFADSSLKGRMSMLDDMREVMGDALKTIGCSVNTADDEELERAFRIVNEKWKPNLVKFDAESFAKSFAREEFWVVHCYPENVFEEVPEEKWDMIDFFIPEEGATMYIDNMVIPKGSKHYESALRFIDYVHRPEVYALFLDEFNFPATTNTEAAKYTTTEPFFSPEDLERCELLKDLGEDLDKYNALWQKIRYED